MASEQLVVSLTVEQSEVLVEQYFLWVCGSVLLLHSYVGKELFFEIVEKVRVQTDRKNVRKMLRLIIQTKRRYKKIVKHKVKTSEDEDNIDSSCTDDENEDGKSSVSHNDQDSDVSFESDNDEEIDVAEIEEEDWVDYTKRSTNEAMEKMENEQIRYWNKTQKKKEMETGDENCHITEREMFDKSC